MTMVQLAIQKCLEKEALCNELYLLLIKQTTDQPDPNGRINIQNWRFLCLVCGVVVPRNRVILNYLQAHLRRCGLDSHTEEGKFAQFAMQVNVCRLNLSNNITSMVGTGTQEWHMRPTYMRNTNMHGKNTQPKLIANMPNKILPDLQFSPFSSSSMLNKRNSSTVHDQYVGL